MSKDYSQNNEADNYKPMDRYTELVIALHKIRAYRDATNRCMKVFCGDQEYSYVFSYHENSDGRLSRSDEVKDALGKAVREIIVKTLEAEEKNIKSELKSMGWEISFPEKDKRT